MKVILLGNGGPRPDPRRAATATLIRTGDDDMLFDVGRCIIVEMAKAGIPLDRVKPVLLTHHHFDHIGGDLYDVTLNTWMHGHKEALRIYGPPETRRSSMPCSPKSTTRLAIALDWRARRQRDANFAVHSRLSQGTHSGSC